MAKQLEVYRDWLGITDSDPPADALSAIAAERSSKTIRRRIRLHYRKMNSHVRKFATGDFAQQSQELLNELAKAMLCLTDTRRKGEYDASLGRAETSKRRKHTLEEILVGRKIIDAAGLEKARNLAKAINLEIRDAVMQQKLAGADAVMQAYAESLGLPYIDLGDVGVSEELAPKVPAVLARQHSCVPVMADHGVLLMASPNPLVPEIEEELRLRIGMPVRTITLHAGRDQCRRGEILSQRGGRRADGRRRGDRDRTGVSVATPAPKGAAKKPKQKRAMHAPRPTRKR